MAIDFSTQSRSQAGAPAAASSIAAAAGSPSELFTKLLVAQIKNQDPLEPSDPGEFVNQLTQLSQMESLQSLTSHSSSSAGAMQGLQALTLGAQVGSELMVATDRVSLAGKPVHGSAELTNAAANVNVVLTGADGREQKIALGAQSAGEVAFAIDPAKLGVASGSYGIRLEIDGKPAQVPVSIAGTLSAVRLSSSGPILEVANVGQIDPSSITRFNGKQPQQS